MMSLGWGGCRAWCLGLGSAAVVALAAGPAPAHAWSAARLPELKIAGGGPFNAHVDINRDGYIDLISTSQGTAERGVVEIRYGSAAGFRRQVDFRYEGPMDYARLGFSPQAVDVNCDGWPDLVVGAYGYSGALPYSGAVLVFFGGPNGFPAQPSQIIEGPEEGSNFGFTIKPLGDFNRDGCADVAVSASTEGGARGKILIFGGSPAGLRLRPESTVTTNPALPWTYFGREFDTGDVTGDGVADIVVGAPTSNEQARPGQVFIYKGSVNGYSSTVHDMLTPPVSMVPTDLYAASVVILGDVDGDGFADIAVGASNFYDGDNSGLTISSGRIFIHFGSANGFRNSGRYQKLAAPDADGFAYFGEVMLGQRDFNGDGYADLIVGASLRQTGLMGDQPFPGFIWIYTGGPGGFTKAPYKRSGTRGSFEGLGAAIDAADLTRDGQMDIVTANPIDPASPGGTLRLYRGMRGLK